MGAKRKTKYDSIVSMYDSGLSIQDCAAFFGITRQAAHAALKVRGYSGRSNLLYGAQNNFHRTGNGRVACGKAAHHLVEKAVKKGILIQKAVCEECGSTQTLSDGRTGIHAHHDDYNRPLEVRWLCRTCHHQWHKHNKAVLLETE